MGPRSYIQLLLASGGLAAFGQQADGAVDFARDIQPILNANCVECHGGVKAAGNVSFVYEDRVINFEGKSGGIVVKPGDVDGSEMIYRITTDDEEDRMPPPDEHPALSDSEIDLIKEWIAGGAEWSGHWAFQPPRKPTVPSSKFEDRATGDVDRFLFSRLEKKGLEPSPVESPGRLLRRLSLGLTGLPPSLEELRMFESDFVEDADSALEAAVDALMSRPAFGERWASLWLDLVRYADSGGLGQDQRRTIWAYRDWVVNALNEDLPFDQFTVKQLAGDLLPRPTLDDLIATACQRNTQTNDEGGTDDEQFRVEAVVDRINTTWQTWGAVTFSCVQCHDHPYDPIRNDEYYQFMAFYNNTADSDLENDAPLVEVPDEPGQYEEVTTLRERILELKQTMWESGMALRDASEWRGLKGIEVESNNSTRYAVVEKPSHDEFHTVGTVETRTHTLIDLPAAAAGSQPITALQLTVLPRNPDTAVRNSEWGFLIDDLEAWVVDEDGLKIPLCFRESVPDVPGLPTDPMKLIGPNGEGWGADSRIHYARKLILIPEQPVALKEGERLSLHIHCNKTGHGSHPMAIERGLLEVSSDSRWSEWTLAGTEGFGWRQELVQLVERLSEIPGTTVPIMADRPDQLLRPTHIFERGNISEKGDPVFAGLPASFTKAAPSPDSPNRLDMAHWWVSENHPLTARVFVNRLWEQLFGVGIVPTLEDFGSSGERPTHPELLDYLAVRFQKDHAWSIKEILREMVLSHAYRQSSRVTPELLEQDPDNRLVARGPRLRLTAEMVRDQSLAVSGLLSQKVGGPPVHPPLPEGVWRPFLSRDKWETPEPGEEDRYRRSLYTYVKRSIPFPTFATFDAPSREFCTPRRLSSNTPLQALVMLNDTVFVECAEALADRIDSELSDDSKQSLAQAYQLVTGRIADAETINTLNQLYEDTKMHSPDSAWTVVAQVLLNLDESLTF